MEAHQTTLFSGPLSCTNPYMGWWKTILKKKHKKKTWLSHDKIRFRSIWSRSDVTDIMDYKWHLQVILKIMRKKAEKLPSLSLSPGVSQIIFVSLTKAGYSGPHAKPCHYWFKKAHSSILRSGLPGPLAPPGTSRPILNITARSYSCTTCSYRKKIVITFSIWTLKIFGLH